MSHLFYTDLPAVKDAVYHLLVSRDEWKWQRFLNEHKLSALWSNICIVLTTSIIRSEAISWSMARSHSHVTVNISVSMIYLWFKTFEIIIILIFTFCCYNLSYIFHNHNLLNKEKHVRNFEAEINLNQIAHKELVLLLSISETASNFGLLKIEHQRKEKVIVTD